MKNCFKFIKQKRPENRRAVSVCPFRRCQSKRIWKVEKIRFWRHSRKYFIWKYSSGLQQGGTGKGPVPEAVIPLRDTLICPEVLPRDQIVEVPATNKENLINYTGVQLVRHGCCQRSWIIWWICSYLPVILDQVVKVLLPASGPGPGGEGAPTCQWSWTRWWRCSYLPVVLDQVKALLPASGPGPGGEGAPTCQWSWTRWWR